MSKKKPPTAKKIALAKKSVRALDEAGLKDAAGGMPNTTNCVAVTEVACACPTGNRCCVNHNQALRRR